MLQQNALGNIGRGVPMLHRTLSIFFCLLPSHACITLQNPLFCSGRPCWDPCVKFDFLTQGSSLAGPAPSICTSQDTPGECNWPGAWQKQSQGSTDPDRPDDQMFKVALAEDNGLILPLFLWTLSTPLGGGGVTECVNAMVSPASQQHRHKLLATTEWTASNALTSLQVSIKLENANTGAADPSSCSRH